ncbi:hypothetical protein [Streptomyces sp. ODS28]|uniref:hypothetical protein n=1 Tax=Streptomyces sp. ODS28 TaxID=3136688 RepID=UPI0031E83C95
MRKLIRAAAVSTAVAGLALSGAAAAQAHDHDDNGSGNGSIAAGHKKFDVDADHGVSGEAGWLMGSWSQGDDD